MQEEKNKAETILFTTGKFIGLEELSKLCGIGSIGFLRDVLSQLTEDYKTKNGALEIVQQGDKWKLNVKKNYLYLTETLLTDSELDGATQETLAVIAYKNPALQSEIIKIRGNGAYDHIKILKELDFIGSEPLGRSKILKLTQKFYDYFDVVENQLKSKIEVAANKTAEASNASSSATNDAPAASTVISEEPISEGDNGEENKT
jgi:segregation and condensation protein B